LFLGSVALGGCGLLCGFNPFWGIKEGNGSCYVPSLYTVLSLPFLRITNIASLILFRFFLLFLFLFLFLGPVFCLVLWEFYIF
jgi:hypothetical protein